MNFNNLAQEDPSFRYLSVFQRNKIVLFPAKLKASLIIKVWIFWAIISLPVLLICSIVMKQNSIGRHTKELDQLVIKIRTRFTSTTKITDDIKEEKIKISELQSLNNHWSDSWTQIETQKRSSHDTVTLSSEKYSGLYEESIYLLKEWERIKKDIWTADNNFSSVISEEDNLIREQNTLQLTLKSLKEEYENTLRAEDLPKDSDENISNIINEEHVAVINTWLKSNKTKYNLIYRSSRDGLNSKSFHSKLNGVSSSNMLVLIQTDLPNKDIIGGFTSKTWKMDSFTYDSSAFIFNLTNKKQYLVTSPENAIFTGENYLIVFGEGDISISDNLKYSNFPQSYASGCAILELTNYAFRFEVTEMEVFQIISDV